MANYETYNKQIEKWMSKASFDKLDLSTIPEGTEINIVGDIVESDLSVDLQNKINNAGGHCWKLEIETGSFWYGTFTYYWNTKATTLEELATELVGKVISGTNLQNEFDGVPTNEPNFGFYATYLKTLSIKDDLLTFSGYSCGGHAKANSNIFTVTTRGFEHTTGINSMKATKLY
jgi:hypothetical protein